MRLFSAANRESFLVNPDGVVMKHYQKVDPDTHTQEVLADLQSLMKGQAAASTGE